MKLEIFYINQHRRKIVKGIIDRYHIVFFSSSISVSGPAENETKCESRPRYSSRDLDVVVDSITISRSRYKCVQTHSFLSTQVKNHLYIIILASTVLQWNDANNRLLKKKENKITLDLEGSMYHRI